MNTQKLLSYVGIGALFYFGAQWLSANVSRRLKVGTPKLDITDSNLLELNAKLTIPLENLTPVAIPINSFSGVVTYGNYILANIAIQNITLQGNESVDIPIDIRIVYAYLAQQLIGLISSGNYLNNLYVKGEILSAGLIIPVNQKIRVL